MTPEGGQVRMTRDPQQTYVLVVCPLCHTRMHPRFDQIGQQIECPDCGTKSPILPPPPDPKKLEREDPGEYDLRDPREFGDPTAEAVVAPRRAPEAAADNSPPELRHPERNAQLLLITCPVCHTRLHPSRQALGKRVKCPDCGTAVAVQEVRAAPRLKTPDLVVGRYDLGSAPPPPPAPIPRTSLLAAQAIPERKPLPPPPRWTMFSGVFSFPWQREAISRWLYMTIGFLVIGLIIQFAATGANETFGGIVGASILAAVALIILIWTLSFSSACVLCVVRETAAGVDVVDEWPDSDWREWVWPLLYLIDVYAVSAGVGYVAYSIALRSGAGGVAAHLIGASLTAVLFPVVLLSVVEHGWILAIFSWSVVRSLFRLPHYWLLFHLETLPLIVGIIAIDVALILSGGLFFAVLLTPPWLAATVLIYGRLIGRMAWHIGDMVERAHNRAAAEADAE